MSLILGTNSIKDTGYDVANSVRFNSGDSAELTKTYGSAGNQKTWTFSFWVKRSGISGSTTYSILEAGHGTTPWFVFTFNNDTINVAATAGSSASWTTTSLFRDSSAWYHIVLAIDTTSSTSSISNGSTDRIRVFVNNVQQTLSSGSVPSQNADLQWNGTAGQHMFGASYGQFMDGYVSEVAFIDGSALNPSSFGEYDSDSPTIWKPKDFKDDVTFGTNGFYLDFEDSSAFGNDVSGNNNDWTVANLAATDQSIDSCTNNFNTPNPLWGMQAIRVPTFAEGNLKITGDGDAQHHQTMGTFAFNKGKWFWEAKFTVSADIGKNKIGIMSTELGSPQTAEIVDQNGSCVFVNEDGGDFRRDNTTVNQNSGTLSHNQIVSVALNMDDGEISIYRAGSLIVDALSIGNSAGTFVTPASVHYRDAGMEFNFGSPPYSESGGNSDGNGYGNFSMSVPSGYFAINSKNLAEYG